MKLNLLVIRTTNPEQLKLQYEQLGFHFEFHQHGNGPFHYASEVDGFVFEIYPLAKSMDKADGALRIGFEVENLKRLMELIATTDWTIVSEITKTEWGETAVLQDMDGRKVELKS